MSWYGGCLPVRTEGMAVCPSSQTVGGGQSLRNVTFCRLKGYLLARETIPFAGQKVTFRNLGNEVSPQVGFSVAFPNLLARLTEKGGGLADGMF